MKTIHKSAWVHIENRKVLMLRAKGKDTPFMPGGKREEGESDEMCLVREIYEELSVNLHADTIEHQFTIENEAHGQKELTQLVMKCYTAQFAGSPTASGEIEELVWWDTSDSEKASSAGKELLSLLYSRGVIN